MKIPNEDAIARSIYEARNGHGCRPWGRLPEAHKTPYRSDARAALDNFIEGLHSDLLEAVDVAYRHGATEWVRLNYPVRYADLTASAGPTD